VIRSALYVLGLACRRLGRGTGATALVVLGISLGAAVVVGVRAGTTVAQDRAVAQAVERIPEASRSVRAVWFGVPGLSEDTQAALDRRARAALGRTELRRAELPEPVSLVLFRETTIGGTFAGLGGVDGLGRWIELRSGRLPERCSPELCEVVRLRSEGRLPQPAGFRLVEVGEAVLSSGLLFGDFLAPTDNALANAEVSPSLAAAAGYHRPAPPPLFLAEGVGELAAAPAFERLYRSYAWVSPLAAGTPRLWEIDRFAEGVTRARSELQARSTSFDLVAPVEEFRSAQAESNRAGHRLALVGGEAAALLFAFAILAAMTLRRDLAAARRRLAWSGARGWQLALLTSAEAAAIALAGTALGFVVGTLGGAFVARRAGAPAGAVLEQSVFSGTGLLLVALVAVLATAVLVVTVAARARRSGPVSPLDVAALAALLTVGLALWRGEDDGDLTLLLPALVTFVAAVAAARLLRPGLRAAERLARGRSLGLRLAVVSLGRNPGYAVAAVSFLVVSFALALFAESYRSTLARGERDAAAFAVPRDYIVREDLRRLIPVLDAAPLASFGDASRILRLTGGVGRLEGESGITLLGLPHHDLALLNWRDDYSDSSPAELSQVIDAPSAPVGVPLPATVLVEASDDVRVAADIRSASGRFRRVELEGRTTLLHGGTLVGLAITPATRLQERGADAGQAATGSLRVSVVGRHQALADWIGVGGARLAEGEASYTLTVQEDARLRPAVPSDRAPVPVVATPRLAAAAGLGGLLPLQIGGERLTVRVAERVARFPGVRGQALVGDVDALLAALNAARPGLGRVNELWLGGERQLDRAEYRAVEVVSRRALEADARQDPIAHGTLLALVVAALVSLGLALAGLLLTVVGDLRDERGELFDLEAEGVGPSLLRRIVQLRALVVALAGLGAGALTGVVLGAVVTDLVSLTARATSAEPPLRLDVDLAVVAAALAAYALLAALLVGTATRRAFPANAVPGRVEAVE